MTTDEAKLKFIGEISANIGETSDLPLQGANAAAHIYPDFAAALDTIDEHSHIWLLVWLHQADRDRLKVVPKRVKSNSRKRGVFALRSPIRPNPIGLTAARLLGREDNILYLDHIDFVDGTPIIDVKPYSVGWDAIFCAQNNSTFETYRKMPVEEVYADMLRQAANFHGDTCVGVTIGMRAAHLAMRRFKCDLQTKELTVEAGVRGCIADAVQGLMQAGNKRLSRPEPLGDILTFYKDGETLLLEITPERFRSVEEALAAPDEVVFSRIEVEHGRKEVAE